MKTRLIYLILVLSLCFSVQVFSQEPPHPPSSGHGNHGNQPAGGSAPIDGGMGFLILLGVANASCRVLRKKDSE
ncbi:MAG: hypothetical protein IPH88_08640 [Bacteroidales bacterium]|nr:hypothetical protein [Bacteroidales bacterium]